MATPAGNELHRKTETARMSLKTLIDELKVQMHLGGMEARGAFEDIEPALQSMQERLDEMSANLKRASDEAEVQAHLAGMEARDRWEALEDTVNTVVEELVDAVVDKGRAPKRAIDRSKVQAHLARLEAEDRLERAAEELKARMRESRSDVLHEATRFVDGLESALLRLRDRLKRDAQ